MRRHRPHAALYGLLLLTYALSVAWSLSSPLPNVAGWGDFQPDEYAHVAVIRYMADYHRFPTYNLIYYPTYHPPLYHTLSAFILVLTRPILGEDAAFVLIRLLTGFCGVGIVYLTYRAARHLAAKPTALLSAALVALIPMRVSLGGGINNENMAALGAAGALAVLFGALTDRNGFTRKRVALLTFWTVVAIGCKVTSLGLLLAGVFAFFARARQDRKPFSIALRPSAIFVLTSVLCWGWWFLRNQRVYGDPFVSNVVDQYWDAIQPGYARIRQTTGHSPAHYAAHLTFAAWRSFWGAFDGFQRFLPAPFYGALLTFQAIAACGWVGWLRSGGRERRLRRFALMLCVLLYAIFISIIYYKYNWRHYSPQGRYFFGLLVPFGVATAIGWHKIVPRKLWSVADGIILCLLLALNLYLLYVIPHRQPFVR